MTGGRQLSRWAGRALGHDFARLELLKQALTHPSADENNNRRLEYLGDAVLELVASDYLYKRHQKALEGGLTQLRQRLVQRATLASVAGEVNLAKYLRYKGADLAPDGPAHEAMLADALEAVFAAVWLDGGIEPAAAVFEKLFAQRLKSVADLPRDAKSLLQEYLQGRGFNPPEYRLAGSRDDPQAPSFRSVCKVPELSLSAEGEGRTIQASEVEAAASVLAAVGESP
ncbi:MAG: ribonuclease III [Gammaproteobacteria bacterium]|nr:ribonuclease III [Gammaproteobacteria bacterium]MYL01789.1 ribonuclease III [Gammaproteobacteria bacterium]